MNFMAAMTSVDTSGVSSATARGATVIEKWMYDLMNFIGSRMNKNVNLYELPATVFAERLTVLWNSFQAAYAARALAGELDKATSTNISESSRNPASSAIKFDSTENLISQRRDASCVNWKWFGVLLPNCSLVLLSVTFAGLVLRYLSIAPDIVCEQFDNVESLCSNANSRNDNAWGWRGQHYRMIYQYESGTHIQVSPVGAIALTANDRRDVIYDRARRYKQHETILDCTR